MKEKTSDFVRFERMFNKIRSEKAENRQTASGTLTPDLLREYLKSKSPVTLGKIPITFTVNDLRNFQRRRKELEKKSAKIGVGIPMRDIWDISLEIDRKRAGNEIKSAVLYRFDNNTLHFQVTASPQSKYRHHQVRVRLEDFNRLLKGGKAYDKSAAESVEGRISWDCDCGRHQFWYRYLAGILNASLTPIEHAYPKVRNPNLRGIACKHALKVFANMKSPSVKRMIAVEMKRQAERVGFGSDDPKFLESEEIKKMQAAKADVDKAYAHYTRAVRDFRKTQGGKKMIKQSDIDKKKAEIAKKAAMKAKEQTDALADRIRRAIDSAKASGIGRDAAIKIMAITAGQSEASLNEIVKKYNL